MRVCVRVWCASLCVSLCVWCCGWSVSGCVSVSVWIWFVFFWVFWAGVRDVEGTSVVHIQALVGCILLVVSAFCSVVHRKKKTCRDSR